MLEVVLISRVTTSFEIMLIVYFFLLTTKELILLLARLTSLALKVTLKVCVDNIFALAINKSSTKI